MRNPSRFMIRNDLDESLSLDIEPEGVSLALGVGEEVSVIDEFATEPATVRCGKSEGGNLVISIWPGDGEVRVEKDGADVLDAASDRGSVADLRSTNTTKGSRQ